MKAIQVKCPSCGARLPAGPEAATVTCEYCDTEAIIRRRSGVFQRAEKVPKPPATAPAAPVATQARTVGGVLVIIGGVLVLLALTIGPMLFMLLRAYFSSEWGGFGVVLVDIDADGVADPVGRIEYRDRDHQVRLAAFDGRDGSERWETDAVGGSDDLTEGCLSLASETVLYVSARGDLRAFALADGRPLWSASLGERAKAFCQRDEDVAVVITKDDRRHAFQLADGTPAPAGSPDEVCTPRPHDGLGGDVSVQEDSLSSMKQPVPGMVAYDYQFKEGVSQRVLMGRREKGTQVPMLAVMDGERILWKSDVPAERPLDVSTSNPDVVMTADRVYALFSFKDFNQTPRVTAFDLLSGERLWESEVDEPTGVLAVRVSSTHVFVTSWHQLEAFDPRTGESRYTVGVSPPSSSD